MEKPVAKKYPRELIKHGDIRIDNYYWLNERENPEVIDYLQQEKRLGYLSVITLLIR